MSFSAVPFSDTSFSSQSGERIIEKRAIIQIDVSAPTFDVQALIEIDVSAATWRPRAFIELVVFDTVSVSAVIESVITLPTFTARAVIEQRLFTDLQPAAAIIEQQIIDPDLSGRLWRPMVRIDGIDISARLTGKMSMRFDESASGIASLSLLPEPGPIDLLAYVGKPVTIDYLEQLPDGVELLRTRLYTGEISTPVYEPDGGIIGITCTTDLQGRIKTMTWDQINTLVGGYYSPHVFSNDADNWQHMLDRLSTTTTSIWIDQSGAIRVTDWSAGPVVHTYTDADRIADTLAVERVDKGALLNHIRITLDFRYSRQLQRQMITSLNFRGSLCDYLTNPFLLPQRQQIENAIQSCGWTLMGKIQYYELWPSRFIRCGSSSAGSLSNVRAWVRSETARVSLCLGATFTLFIRWARTITETYVFEVNAPKSIEANGDLAVTEDYGIQAATDDTAWEQDVSAARRVTGSGNTTLSGLDEMMPAGAYEQENGDWVYAADQDEYSGRQAMEQAQLTLQNKARVEILRSHRGNEVTFETPIDPMIALNETRRIDSANLQATGVVSSIRHLIDIDSGDARTTIVLSVLQSGAAGVVVETPLGPVQEPVEQAFTEYPRIVSPLFHLGGRISSFPFDESLTGYISNYEHDPDNEDPFNVNPPNVAVYPERMIVDTMEISETDRAVNLAAAHVDVVVNIDNSELTETA